MSATVNWWDRAACRDMPRGLFFPQTRHGTCEAKAICATCPVTAPCLADQLGYERGAPVGASLYGVYGGLSANERGVILAAERKQARETAAKERGEAA